MTVRRLNQRSQEPLAQVRITFSEFKNRHPGSVKIPLSLRRLAVDAVNSGIRPADVVTAAGISASALHVWRKAASRPVRELTVVPNAVTPPVPPLSYCARVTFGAVVIELPVAAITSTLLRELSRAMS